VASVRNLANFRFSLVISAADGGPVSRTGTRSSLSRDLDGWAKDSQQSRFRKFVPKTRRLVETHCSKSEPIPIPHCLSSGSFIHHGIEAPLCFGPQVARPAVRTRITTCQELDARDETEERGMQDARETRSHKNAPPLSAVTICHLQFHVPSSQPDAVRFAEAHWFETEKQVPGFHLY
jgi:hypothetical protein